MTRSVLVVGMHRSGTSLVAQLVASLGMVAPTGRDRLPADKTNPTGHWESRRLMRANDVLLFLFGGTTLAPPKLSAGWQTSLRSRMLRPVARHLFNASFRADGWMWKDPQICLTLPFWALMWPRQPAIVYVRRSPAAICSSLVKRDDITTEHAMAVWERYLRHLFAALGGQDIVCVDYDDLLDQPDLAVKQLAAALTAAGVELSPNQADPVATVIPGLAHHRAGLPHSASPEQRSLHEVVSSLPFVGSAPTASELGPETPGLDRIFARRRLDEVARNIQSIATRSARA